MVLGTLDGDLSAQGKKILAKLEVGELLTGDELKIIWRIVQASEKRSIAFLKICGIAMFLLLAGIFAAKHLLGLYNEEVNAGIFLVFSLAATVIFFVGLRYDNCRMQIEARLRCDSCGKKVAGKQVRKLVKSNACPLCSKSWPLRIISDDSCQ